MNGGCKPLRWWTSFKQTFCLVGLLNISNVFPRFFPRFLSGWSKAYLIRKTCWSLIEDMAMAQNHQPPNWMVFLLNMNSPCWWWNHARIPHTFSWWITMFVDDLDFCWWDHSWLVDSALVFIKSPFLLIQHQCLFIRSWNSSVLWFSFNVCWLTLW